jgi:hypothetical protein
MDAAFSRPTPMIVHFSPENKLEMLYISFLIMGENRHDVSSVLVTGALPLPFPCGSVPVKPQICCPIYHLLLPRDIIV